MKIRFHLIMFHSAFPIKDLKIMSSQYSFKIKIKQRTGFKKCVRTHDIFSSFIDLNSLTCFSVVTKKAGKSYISQN
jgi:hypothetical protein